MFRYGAVHAPGCMIDGSKRAAPVAVKRLPLAVGGPVTRKFALANPNDTMTKHHQPHHLPDDPDDIPAPARHPIDPNDASIPPAGPAEPDDGDGTTPEA